MSEAASFRPRETNMFYFPLSVLKGIDLAAGLVYLLFPGAYANGSSPPDPWGRHRYSVNRQSVERSGHSDLACLSWARRIFKLVNEHNPP